MTINSKVKALPLLLMMNFAFGASAHAGHLSGTIKNDAGVPQAGVIVRVTEAREFGNSEFVYTDSQGRYSLETGLVGKLELRLRAPYHRDFRQTLTLAAHANLKRDFVMARMSSAQEISDSLPAAYHFGNLPFDKEGEGYFTKYQFQRDCLTCHQIGNPYTRSPRTPEGWLGTIERMHRYLMNPNGVQPQRRAEILSAGLDGKPLSVRPVFPVDPTIFSAKVYEYPLAKALLPHDAEVSPDDGLVYIGDNFGDDVIVTDLAKGTSDYYKHPEQGAPIKLPMWGTRHGLHSQARGPDGKWYITAAVSHRIAVFDPKTRQFEESIPVESYYPHTIRADKDGILWFTLTAGEAVGRLDPVTRKVTVIPLPPLKSLGVAGTTTPYGLDISPVDGTIWMSRLFGDALCRIDPKTLAVTQYASPVRGPRRLRFDAAGQLWLAGFSDGILARLEPKPLTDPKGFSYELYPIPQFAPGYQPAPYALAVNPQTQDVWINENLTNRIFRFIPREKRFVAYPMALYGTYTRDFSFTKDGKACTSNSPAPAAALEGGVPELICIAP